MQLPASLDRAKSAYENRKYVECYEILESWLKEFSRRCQTADKIFQVENLHLLAEHSRNEADRKNKEVTCRQTGEKFEALLQKTRTVPLSEDGLWTELIVLYNWLYHRCLMNCLKPVSAQVQPDVISCFIQSLTRVQNFLKACHREPLHIARLDTQTTVDLINVCCLKVSESSEKLTAVFILVCSLWSFLLLNCGKYNQAITCLQSLDDKLNLKVGCESELGHLCQGGPVSIGNPRQLSDVVSFLLALCFYGNKNFTSCMKYARRVQFKGWHIYTKYLEGIALFREEKYSEAVGSLDCVRGDNSGTRNTRLEATTLNLIGTCLTKLGHLHLAVQKFKEAIEVDFSFLLPVYNISLQYRTLQLYDAELESLNLLVTALESEHKKSQMVNGVSEEGLMSRLMGPTDITLLQGTYVLARRCLELKRYDVASEKYLDLLSHVEEFGFPEVDSMADLVLLPPLPKIYEEVLYSLLSIGNYKDCISICDRLLTCQPSSQSQRMKPAQDTDCFDTDLPFSQLSGGSRKRQRSGWSQSQHGSGSVLSASTNKADPQTGVETGVIALVYKADALVQLERYTEAVECLQEAVKELELADCSLESRNESDEVSQSVEPNAKRQRLNSDVSSKYEENKDVFSEDESCTLAGVYGKLGATLALQEKHREALHFLRLGVQICPGKLKLVYNVTLILWKLGRDKEAAQGWVESRRIDTRADGFYLNNVLKSKRDELKSLGDIEDSDVETVSSLSQSQILQLDVACLEYLIKFRSGLASPDIL